MKKKQQLRLFALLLAAVLVVDQAIKFWVKTHMQIGEEIHVLGTWFNLRFIENVGFAFGMHFGGVAGKIVLTLFRIAASGAIGWYIIHAVRRGIRTSPLVALSLILAGALGNLIDSCFYGLIFNAPYYEVASLFPPEGGYAPLLQGRVVDMFYFPLFEFDWPRWLPLLGGRHFEFFNAIFNFADSAVTVGVAWLLIDQVFIAPKKKNQSATD